MGFFDLLSLSPKSEKVESSVAESYGLRGDEPLSQLSEMYVSLHSKVGELQQQLNEKMEEVTNPFIQQATPLLQALALMEERIKALAKMQRDALLTDGKKTVDIGNISIAFRKASGALSIKKPYDEYTACKWLLENGYERCVKTSVSLNKDVIKDEFDAFIGGDMFSLSKGRETITVTVNMPDLKKIAG
jgi:phage host-nuclease inhibitor protein Gam